MTNPDPTAAAGPAGLPVALLLLRPDARVDDADLQRLLDAVLPPVHSRRARIGAAAAAAGTGAAATVVLLAARPFPVPADFLTYRYAIAPAASGVDVYAANITGPGLRGQPFTYPPVASILLWPTAVGSWQVAYVLWCSASVAVLAAVLLRSTPATVARRPLVAAAVVAAASATAILGHNVGTGQVNLALMGLCLADIGRRDDSQLGRVLPRGVLIGIAAAAKLTPGLFLPYLLVTGQRRCAAWALASAATATGVGAVLRPEMTHTYVLHVIWDLDDRVKLAHPIGFAHNISVPGLLHGVGAGSLAVPASLTLAAVALWVAARVHRDGRSWEAALVVGIAAAAVSPWSWDHHWVYLLPALAVLATQRGAPRHRAAGAALALVLITSRWLPDEAARAVLLLVAASTIMLIARASAPRHDLRRVA